MVCKKNTSVGKGIHSFRLGQDAAFDLILTLICAILLGYIPHGPTATIWIIICLTMGIIIHSLVCVDTSTHKWIYKNQINKYPLGIYLIIVGIFIMIRS